MEGFEDQKNQDIDTAKLKLNNTKHIISEIQDKIQQLLKEREISSSQHQKKMKNLNNVQATQYLKLTKLDSDINGAEQVLHSRLAEQKSLLKLTEDNEKAMKATKEETNAMTADFQKKCRELEDDINEGYLQIQTDKDMEVLLEITQSTFKDPATLPHFYEILRNKREAILKLRQDFNKELSQLERMQTAISKELKAKQQDLATFKQMHSTLTNHYATIKKLKRDYLTNMSPIPSIPDPRP